MARTMMQWPWIVHAEHEDARDRKADRHFPQHVLASETADCHNVQHEAHDEALLGAIHVQVQVPARSVSYTVLEFSRKLRDDARRHFALERR